MVKEFKEQEQQMLQNLKLLGQEHIIQDYNNCFNLQEKINFLDQYESFQKQIPNGLQGYIQRAKKLIYLNQNNITPFQDLKISNPLQIFQIDFKNYEKMKELEKIGKKEIDGLCFVLVAGGLGERLGFQGIKINMELDLLTHQTYIQYYIKYILALQKRSKNPSCKIPLLIMTSDDTHSETMEILQKNNQYGMEQNQIIILKQDKVPAIQDVDCKIELIKNSLKINTKPHGHGDIHNLIYKNNIHKIWKEQGKKWMYFFQDTNPLCFRSILAQIGISQKNNLIYNTLSMPRKPGEQLGAICRLTTENKKILQQEKIFNSYEIQDQNENEKLKLQNQVQQQSNSNQQDQDLTIVVEYNELEQIFQGQQNKNCQKSIKNQDISEPVDKNGFSRLPGNTNTILIKLNEYFEILEETQGIVPEFINPKFKDDQKLIFSSPARLETKMSDFPLLIQNLKNFQKYQENIGVTQVDREFCFAACKNNIQSAIQKQQLNLNPECVGSTEFAFYNLNTKLLELAGVQITEKQNKTVNIQGIQYKLGPKIVLDPEFGITLEEIKENIKGEVKISFQSSLIIQKQVEINKLDLNGHLEIDENLESQKHNDKNQINNMYVDTKNYKNYIDISNYPIQEITKNEKIRGYKLL
ncbi:hypothetical protein PPERSA_06531 [Pseudocohnilembus persalinus]|uniref:UTP-monosaccharide-1-phosphate uridylyltransferase n=1 Tax=Pseudocohnilembus persalinus TaxID=266149 RepID=A0A0V0QRS3_PSEPJ|nr:hypothetical protein PPERSA_06531 [Pseudocohnilembus persalinus]|eukprot:KRX04897.1 hypothetical protein PPERSA_06531 [Pseudocohnilembus persalinus]